MNADQRLIAIAAIVSGSLYCAMVFGAGLFEHNAWAIRLAILTVGVNYLAYFSQLAAANRAIQVAFVAASVVVGGLAGLSLLLIH